MGLFEKVKGVINDVKDQITHQAGQKQEEEAKRRQEEANRFNPNGKSLQWFSSEDGIKTFNEYITAQNYFLEEIIKKEHQSKYSEYSFDVFVSVVHKDAKIPFIFFKNFVNAINVQILKDTVTTNMLTGILSEQAKPFYIDDDGETVPLDPTFTPQEIVSLDENPALIFIKNFDCFNFNDDAQGSLINKWDLWSNVLIWIGSFSSFDKEIISKNPWVFSKELYFNDLGTVRTAKDFYKKCMELTTDEMYKSIFEKNYNNHE